MEKESGAILEGKHIDDAIAYVEPKLHKYDIADWGVVRDAFELWARRQFVPLITEEIDYVWEKVTQKVRERKRVPDSDSGGVHVHTWAEIESLEFPENPWRIKNLIPLEGFVIIAGVSGDGKSFISMKMADDITMPRPFLNEPTFKVMGTNVLYIDGEMSKSELQRRGKQMGFSDKREHKLLFVNQDDVNLQSEDCNDLSDVMDIVEKEKVGVVFVDTLRAVAGGMEENKAEEVRKFFNRFKPLKDMGVCVIFLDHLRKGYGPRQSEPQKDNLLASQDKTASVEGLLMIQKQANEPLVTVHQRKNRLGPESPSFDVCIRDTDMDPKKNRIVVEFKGMHASIESIIEKAKVSALKALEAGAMTRQELLEHLQKSEGIGKRSAHVALKALNENKLVEVEKIGKKHKFSTKKADIGDDENKNLLF
jgi:archaellum biogenesis ATPase FlaH/DNA-binding transcriptional ArsR family regulator